MKVFLAVVGAAIAVVGVAIVIAVGAIPFLYVVGPWIVVFSGNR